MNDKNKQQVGYSIYNPITGETKYTDFQGSEIPFPEGGSVTGFTINEDEDLKMFEDGTEKII